MSVWRVVTAMLLGSMLAACGGDKGFKPSPLPKFEPRIDARVVWERKVGNAGDFIFAPVGTHDLVCAAGTEDQLFCFRAADGKLVWKTQAGVKFSGGVGAGENMILVGTASGEVIAWDMSGTLLWRSQVSTEVLSAPVGSQSSVIVRAGDSTVFGLSAKDGAVKWRYEGPREPLVLRSNPGMAIINDTAAVIGFPAGRLVKLGLTDGALIWDIAVTTPRGDNELERLSDIVGTPLIAPGKVCAIAYQGRIGCFDQNKGEQIWARSASSASGLTANDRNVYYTEADSVVVALDKTAGASVWRQDKLLYRRLTAPTTVGDWIVVGDLDGYVHILSGDDGAFVARVATDGSAIVAAPVKAADGVVVQTQAGGLYMIELKSRK
jgi:outer membrane protein assembly factor BamB